jgi:hypothetical protein
MDQSKWLPRPYMTRIWFRMAEDAASACTECSCGGGSLGMDSRRTKVNLNVSTKSEACVNRRTEGSTLSEKQHV